MTLMSVEFHHSMERIPIPFSKPGPVIDGWLFLLCFLLTIVYPASVLYGMITSTGPALFRSHHSTGLILPGVYSVLFPVDVVP